MTETVQRVLNFSAGPAKLPVEVSQVYYTHFVPVSSDPHISMLSGSSVLDSFTASSVISSYL